MDFLNRCRLLVLTSSLFLCNQALAADEICDAPEAPETTRVYFANGMNNSPAAAHQSRRELQGLLTGVPDLAWGSAYLSNVAYNVNEGGVSEMLEAYGQHGQDYEHFWVWMNHMEMAPQEFQDAYAENMSKFNEDISENDPDLRGHLAQYVRDLKSGKKVLIVAHSQGNFYANNAYRVLLHVAPQYQKSIGIVAVATPSPIVQDGGPYFTDPEDETINWVREHFSRTLAANMDPFNNPGDTTGHHGFQRSYLVGYGNHIRDAIVAKIAELEPPPVDEACSDIVSVRTSGSTNRTSTSALSWCFLKQKQTDNIDQICQVGA